jgi:hypothetical protein
MTTFYCLRFETPPTWRARSPYLYPPGTGWLSYNPRHWILFSSPPKNCRATQELFEPASTRISLNSNSLAPFFYNHISRTEQKTSFPTIHLLLLAYPLSRKFVYRSVASSSFIIAAFRRHVTIYLTSKLAQVVEFLTCIQEVPGSSLKPDNNSLVWSVSWFVSVPQNKFRDLIIN